MSVFQALVLALLQGVTELFPVSSLGHTVILPKLLRWNIDQADPTFLAFVVLLHVGTATALLIYFWRDWLAIARGVLRSVIDGRMHGTPDERLGWRLIAGTIPVGLAGNLALGQQHGCRAVREPDPRGRGALRVSPRNPGDLRRRRPQNPGLIHAGRAAAFARLSSRWCGRRRGGLLERGLSHAILSGGTARPVCLLLRGLRDPFTDSAQPLTRPRRTDAR